MNSSNSIKTLFFASVFVFLTGIAFSLLMFGDAGAEEVGSTSSPLLSGTDDLAGPLRNATVRVKDCTGTLITDSIVITSGHCIGNRNKPAAVSAFPHGCSDWEDPRKWNDFNPPRTFSVRFGHDSANWLYTATAAQYSLPGCADIIMLRLSSPVPASVAVPVAVQTQRRSAGFWRNKQLQMVGWGSSGLEDLWQRTAETGSRRWSIVGHANLVTGMAALNGSLFAATEGNSLWARPADSTYKSWRKIGHANNVVAMTASKNKLFAATKDNGLWIRDAVPHEVNWAKIGHANNVVAMAAANGALWAATRDNKLWVRDATAAKRNWRHVGHANGVVGMAAANGKLFAATTGNNLWARDLTQSNVDWQKVGEANRVRAMTAIGGNLYASTSPELNADGTDKFPRNTWPIRQAAGARWAGYPCGGGTYHVCASGEHGAAIRPGDSGGPLYWLRPGESPVLIGVTRQTREGGGGRFAATFAGTGDDNNAVPKIGSWIEAMANPAKP